ncbi:rhodanese-like domain-containing protein [Mannheimia massilioguelmaensis]|uniref:rhodanese-like domain-containing protein n=1 Tax=Mannheimia massilioguelmaensis TaxID=1604354 RepID=UPI00097C72A6|nr:rhodanese-like domain-containing protein [Mannheimia massilioguelmaensis]
MEELMPMAITFAKNHTLLVVAWIAVFVFVLVQFIKSATSKVKIVSNAEATSLINNQDAIVIDLRNSDEFKRGHIAGSMEFSATDIKNQNLGKLEQYKERHLILTCANGITARSSAQLLSKQGFSHVYTLNEGISGWRAENLPLVK